MSSRERPRPGLGIIEPCLPSPAKAPPSGRGWLHEIKHDGFRILARRDSAGVRLITRRTPIEQRKRKLAKLARRPHAGIVLNEVFEGEGDILFAHACKLGCEGIVSKRLGSHYRSGRSKHWVKVKNPEAPAVKREAEEDWGRATASDRS
jgi:ATP-dependent DNA ligase